ncbi:MAG TPA: outer membrane lipoprotein carrier protein LolA [Thermoanaerobaculaceae bacterium]|nr:outer membrane lipoprotein carrier protein LolA [Thermoanaerobaculaceae bacterium]
MIDLVLLLALAAAPDPDALDHLSAALGRAAGWQAEFVQRYTPEGFDTGTTESGHVTLAPPAQLRFDYTSGAPRVFASDGSVGRLVDPGAASCDAVRLDAGAWGRLPLAAALDPTAARRAFVVRSEGQEIRLVPREPTPELAEISITIGPDGLPASVTVRDASGDRNHFTFSGWSARGAPPPSFFRPSLPGSSPCAPEQ